MLSDWELCHRVGFGSELKTDKRVRCGRPSAFGPMSLFCKADVSFSAVVSAFQLFCRWFLCRCFSCVHIFAFRVCGWSLPPAGQCKVSDVAERNEPKVPDGWNNAPRWFGFRKKYLFVSHNMSFTIGYLSSKPLSPGLGKNAQALNPKPPKISKNAQAINPYTP